MPSNRLLNLYLRSLLVSYIFNQFLMLTRLQIVAVVFLMSMSTIVGALLITFGALEQNTAAAAIFLFLISESYIPRDILCLFEKGEFLCGRILVDVTRV